MLQTVDQAGIHHIVHTTMPQVASLFCILVQNRVTILFHQCFFLFCAQETMGVDVVHLRSICTFECIACNGKFFCRILGSIPLGTSEFEQTVIWLRSHHVMLDFHYLTFGCTHQGSSVVTVTEFLRFLTCVLFYPFLAYEAFCIHGNQGSESVATVNVHTLCHRTKTMSSIEVTTVFHVVLHTPMKVVLIIVIRVFPVILPEFRQLVNIGTFRTDHFTEYTVLNH